MVRDREADNESLASQHIIVFMNSSRETFITPQRPLNDISSVTDIDES